MASEEQLKILSQGIRSWNSWRSERLFERVDLRGADLRNFELKRVFSDGLMLLSEVINVNFSQADLTGAYLTGANVTGGNFEEAILQDAHLNDTQLYDANFAHADLRNASLCNADLTNATLKSAKLIDSDLRACNFRNANLSETEFQQANFSETIFNDVDLSFAKGLEKACHWAPSCVDHRTILRSKNVSIEFWRGCGVPDALIDNISSLVGDAIQFYSCFISYSSKDQEFADRLHADLQNAGVRCWFAPHDLPIGEKIWDGLDEAIRLRDKVVLILSRDAIASDWVEDEVSTAFEEERRREKTMLFPIRLDHAVMDTSEAWASKLRARNIGDFTKWKDHDAYKAKFDRVLHDLKTDR